MAKKQSKRAPAKRTPSKPPRARGGGGAANDGGASPDMDSAERKFSALPDAHDADSQSKRDSDFLADWKARKSKLKTARDALWNLPASEYENIIREVIRTAPSSWHVRMLILEALRWLKRLSKGSGDPFLGIPGKDEGVIGRVHYQLARITREFNVSLTAKSTPQWLMKAKQHPEFKRAWKEFSETKGEHEKEETKQRVIEVDSYGGQMGMLKLRCVFEPKQVHMEWRRGDEITDHDTRERISSNGVLQHWLSGVLTDFDKGLDYPGSPMSHAWAERWADEELYMKHFMPHAEREWKPDELDELQARACGLLSTNNNLADGKPRRDFAAFKSRIKRLALKQIRFWRDSLVPPVKKVSQK